MSKSQSKQQQSFACSMIQHATSSLLGGVRNSSKHQKWLKLQIYKPFYQPLLFNLFSLAASCHFGNYYWFLLKNHTVLSKLLAVPIAFRYYRMLVADSSEVPVPLLPQSWQFRKQCKPWRCRKHWGTLCLSAAWLGSQESLPGRLQVTEHLNGSSWDFPHHFM